MIQSSPLQPGQLLQRGVSRHLASHGFACVEELVPARGLRVDVMALGPKGEIWVVDVNPAALISLRTASGRAIWNGQTGFSLLWMRNFRWICCQTIRD